MNICEHITGIVDSQGAELAFVAARSGDRDIKLSYAEFDAQMKRLSVGLSGLGIGKGDRVILLIPMQIELYLCMAAIMRIGAVSVFVDPHMQRDHFDNCCRVVGPKAFIGVPKAHLLRIFCKHLRKLPIHLCTRGLPRFIARGIGKWTHKPLTAATADIVQVDHDHPALIGFTTGSSGLPRGSTRTHGFLNAQIEALFQPEEKRQSSVDLPGFPVLPLENLIRGRTTVLPPIHSGRVAEVNAETVLKLAARYEPEMMSGSPSYLHAIGAGARAQNRKLDSVRVLFTGGAPISAGELRQLAQVWPHARIVIVYGSTEAEPVASIDASEIVDDCYAFSLRGQGYCSGYPVDQVETIILPLDFDHDSIDCLESAALPDYRIGEIAVRGPHVNTRYWNDPQGEKKNKIKTSSGTWHRMGDAGYRDEKGRLWLVGRSHMAIRSPWIVAVDKNPQGFNPFQSDWIFPYQVEAIINNNAAVKRSAYVGINKGYHLVVELVEDSGDIGKLEETLQEAISGFPLTRVWFQPLPLDPRHNSKIEYQSVMKSLQEQGA